PFPTRRSSDLVIFRNGKWYDSRYPWQSAEAMSPQLIAHYHVTSKLGEGGMGEVYRATDTKLGRDVAIKVIPDIFAQDASRMARFAREAQVLASLNHPNIAAIYGVEDRALIMGTAAYMSPEQARGAVADRRSDIWAFGVLFYEMLTGRRMFTGETVSDTLAAVLKTDPDWSALPRETPPAIRRLLRRCLERD